METMEFSQLDLENATKANMEEIGRMLDPPFEIDKRNTNVQIIEDLTAHVESTAAKLVAPWVTVDPEEGDQDPPDDPSPDREMNEEEKAEQGIPVGIVSFGEDLDDLIQMTAPPLPHRQYLSNHERKFRATLHSRLKGLRDAFNAA